MLGPAGRSQRGRDGTVGMDRLTATAEDGGIAGLETQRGGIRGDVGPAFVNDADGADGHAHLLDLDAVGACPLVHHLADGIRQCGHLLDAGCHRLDAGIIEPQAVQHGCGKPFFPARLEILLIRLKQGGGLAADRDRHRAQDLVFLRGGKLGQPIGGGTGLAAHLMDGFVDGFRCRRHGLGARS